MIKYNGKDIIPRIDGKEISRVMYNGKEIYPNNNVIEIQKADVIAGDICAFDGTNKRFFRFVDSGATDDIKKYTPIGVVVIPTSHDVYGTGECGVMSLKEMDYISPDTGSTSHQNIFWGGYGTDISQLPNLDVACYIGTGDNLNENVQGTYGYCHLPSDKFGVNNPYDPDTNYYNTANNSYRQAPSPYKADGTRNPAYYQTSSPSSNANTLADFDGVGNSEVLWSLANSQSGWKTASSIINIYDDGYYPAACCCWRYHTDGTKQGDWYLPACGELGYMMVRFNKINIIINRIKTCDSSIATSLHTNHNYWSSSEYGIEYARRIYTNNGDMQGNLKRADCYVRAFLRV